MSNIDITIVICAYNVSSTLERTLRSVYPQIDDSIEVIIVDDGSSDATPSIIEQAQINHPNIRTIRHDKNKSLHEVRRTGAYAASGEFTLYLDGDDELRPDAIEIIRDHLNDQFDVLHGSMDVHVNDNSDIDVASAWSMAIFDDERLLQGYEQIYSIWQRFDTSWGFTGRLIRSSVLKAAFEKMPELYLNGCEDCWEFFVIASLSKAELIIPEAFYTYNYGDGSYGGTSISKETLFKLMGYIKTTIKQLQDYIHSTAELQQFESEGEYAEILLNRLLVSQWAERMDVPTRLQVLQELIEKYDNPTLLFNLLLWMKNESWYLTNTAHEHYAEFAEIIYQLQTMYLGTKSHSSTVDRLFGARRIPDSQFICVKNGVNPLNVSIESQGITGSFNLSLTLDGIDLSSDLSLSIRADKSYILNYAVCRIESCEGTYSYEPLRTLILGNDFIYPIALTFGEGTSRLQFDTARLKNCRKVQIAATFDRSFDSLQLLMSDYFRDTQGRISTMEAERIAIKSELDAVRNSLSFRLGRKLTQPARVLRDISHR